MSQDSTAIKNYVLARHTIAVADTEETIALTVSRPLLIRISLDDITDTGRFSFTASGSATGRKIYQGGEWRTPGFQMGQKTIYVQSPRIGAIFVIETWEAP